MKKFATILIAVIMVAGLATPVFAFGTGSDQRDFARIRHGDQRGHERGRHVYHQTYNQRGHERSRRVYHQTYNYYAPSRDPRVVVSLPLVPLPGVSHMFPRINIRLR